MKSVALGIEVARRLGEVGAVDVRDEAEGQVAPAVVPKRPVGHDRPEVRAADADVDDVRDRLARVAAPVARADSLGERRHAVEHLVHIRDDVAPVDDQRPVARHAQGDVQHRAVLGHVDVLACEHGVAPRGYAGLGGELHQEVERFARDAILRVVEVDAGRLGRQAGASPGVGGEELAQVGARDLPVVGGERAVRRVSLEVERLCGCHHSPAGSMLVRVPPGSSARSTPTGNR